MKPLIAHVITISKGLHFWSVEVVVVGCYFAAGVY